VGSHMVRRVGARCRKVVHSPGRCLGSVVLGPPALTFSDGPEQGQGVGGGVGLVVGPDEPGQPVRADDAGGHPFDVRGKYPGGVEDLADDGGPVGLVLPQCFARPIAGDQDAAAVKETYQLKSVDDDFFDDTE
jgi:hypothetical protein